MASHPSLRHASPRSVVWSWILALSALAAGTVALPSACAGPKECERNSDCDRSYCSQGECKRDCVMSSVDCPPGFLCNDIGRCESPDGGLPDGSAGGGAGTGGTAGAGGVPSQGGNAGSPGTGGVSQGGMGGGPAGSGGGSTGALKEFDNCAQDGDCTQGLVCRPMGVSQTSRCTRTCSASSQCMAGTRCAPVPPLKEKICAFDDDGKPCSGTGGECADFCMTGPGANYCTSECANGSQCPAGWGCSVPIGGTRVCLRLDKDCGVGSDCAGQICDNQTLIVNGCTMQCSSAYDCPQRPSNLPMWSCEGGVCFRPGDVFGPASKTEITSWACNAQGTPVNVCNDGLTFDSPPTLTCNETVTVPTKTPCVTSCLPTGGCGQGFACVNNIVGLGNPAIPTPICIRAGFVEIGQPCTKNEDCMFGVCSTAKKCTRDCSADQVCPKGFACAAGTCQ